MQENRSAGIHFVVSSDPALLLERAADGFLQPFAAATDPFPSPAYVLVLRQGGLREDLHGRIDLIAPRSDGLAILDVKTGGRFTAEAARQRAKLYAPQRDAYVGAAEALAGRRITEFAFHFSGSGQHVAEGITPELREDGVRRVAELLHGIEAGDRALTSHAQECRFCGYRRAGWCEGVLAKTAAAVAEVAE